MRTLALAAFAFRSALAARTRESFDFEWKFLLGQGPQAPGTCNATNFPVPVDSVQCLGLQQAAASNADACVQACCAAVGCTLWQFGGGAGCWLGNDCSNNLTGSGWVGGAVASGPQPPPAPVCKPGTACDPSLDDSGWANISVPHDFIMATGTFQPNLDPNHGALPRNVSWYRKHFSLDGRGWAPGQQLVWLTFDGVFRAADVYLNGVFVGHHEEGYTSFKMYLHNVTGAPLNYGPGAPNVLAVFVNALQPELWCYEGGGIYRHVWLESAALLSFAPWSLYVPSYITGTISGSDAAAPQTATSAQLMPAVDVANAGTAAAMGTVTFQLLSPDGSGTVVATASAPYNVTVGGWQRVVPAAISFGSSASPVQLWNTQMNPPLYTMVATLLDGQGNAVDSLSTTIGVRSAVFDPRLGFVLNGVKVMLQGTSNHLGFGGVGMAMPDRVQEYVIATLKRMGGNAYRTAHNPVSPEFVALADRYGMLVWEENRFITAGVQPMPPRNRYLTDKNSSRVAVAVAVDVDGVGGHGLPPAGGTPGDVPAADPTLLQDAQDMVLRDRNRASIIIWSLCNELGCVADSPTGNTLAAQFKEVIYLADPSRPITGNTVQSPYLSNQLVDPFSRAMDVQSFSYEYNAYTEYHAAAPWKPIGGGESASCVMDRGFYGAANATTGHLGPTGQPGSRDSFSCVASAWQAAVSELAVFGSFAWTGFDYYGEVYPFGGAPDVSSHFGIHDLAGYGKDSVGYYNAWWRDASIAGACNSNASVGISPSDWTQPVPNGSPIDVSVFTCAASVSLWVNGVQQTPAQQAVPQYGYVTWPAVSFKPGNLTAVAYNAAGQVVGTRSVLAAGAPYQLRAWVETGYAAPRADGANLTADGQDAALIGVALLDAAGVLVPIADVNVTFTLSGPARLLGVANGDPADRSPVTASWRLTWKGLARAIIASAAPGEVGSITVSATAPGLQPGVVQLVAS